MLLSCVVAFLEREQALFSKVLVLMEEFPVAVVAAKAEQLVRRVVLLPVMAHLEVLLVHLLQYACV